MIKLLQYFFGILSLVLLTYLFTSLVSAAKPESYTWNLNPDWNFISPTLETEIDAAKICKQNKMVVSVSELAPDPNSMIWKQYFCNNPVKTDNFTLKANVGYMINSTQSMALTVKGSPAPFPPVYDWTLGFNAIGLAYADQYSLLAQNLCGNLVDTTFQVTEVTRWLNGGWDTHLCSGYYPVPVFNNFPIVKGAGYLLKVVSQSL